MIVASLFAILSLEFCVYGTIIDMLSTHSDDFLIMSAILGCILFLVSFCITSILHELGHAFFGWLTGFELVALGFGNRVLVRRDEGWKWEKKVIAPGAAAYYLGIKRDENDTRFILMFAGGLIVHISLTVLFLLLGWLTGYWYLCLAQIFLNLSSFMFNANPNGISDGAKIWDLWKYPESAKYAIHSLRYGAQIMLDDNGADLKDFVLDVSLSPDLFCQVKHLNQSELYLFQHQLEEAQKRLESLVAFSHNSYIVTCAKLVLLAVYVLQDKKEEVRELIKDKAVKKLLKYPMADCQAIAALYHLRISRDEKALAKAIKLGNKSLAISPMLRDERAYYTQLLEMVEKERQMID